MNKKTIFTQFVTVIVILFLTASPLLACYAIVAGKKATADGSVLFGHNEDNGRKFVSGMWKVEHASHESGEFVKLQSGTRIPQAAATLSYWWLQMPERDYSDGFLNERGVAIVTDNCPSREDNPELTDGGIGGPVLRRLVAERAGTAREGVEVVGSLIDKYGYTASGRTMIICDAEEGWLVAMVNGKHWVAQRVPDDMVAVIANTYTIREIDLADTDNFLGSPDIVDYAVKRGWYDPSDGPFSFEKAYGDPKTRTAIGNTHRQWSGMRRLSADPVPLPEDARLPFAVKPKEPMTVAHLTEVLRDHYEDSPYEPSRGYATRPAHKRHTAIICAPATNSSGVFQLRSWLPVEIGSVWWLAMWQPCSTPYMPLYLGLDSVPEQLGFDPETAGSCPFCTVSPEFGPAYQTFSDLAAWVDEDYAARIPGLQAEWNTLENACYRFQNALENELIGKWESDPAYVREILGGYTQGVISRAVQKARVIMSIELSEK